MKGRLNTSPQQAFKPFELTLICETPKDAAVLRELIRFYQSASLQGALMEYKELFDIFSTAIERMDMLQSGIDEVIEKEE